MGLLGQPAGRPPNLDAEEQQTYDHVGICSYLATPGLVFAIVLFFNSKASAHENCKFALTSTNSWLRHCKYHQCLYGRRNIVFREKK